MPRVREGSPNLRWSRTGARAVRTDRATHGQNLHMGAPGARLGRCITVAPRANLKGERETHIVKDNLLVLSFLSRRWRLSWL